MASGSTRALSTSFVECRWAFARRLPRRRPICRVTALTRSRGRTNLYGRVEMYIRKQNPIVEPTPASEQACAEVTSGPLPCRLPCVTRALVERMAAPQLPNVRDVPSHCRFGCQAVGGGDRLTRFVTGRGRVCLCESMAVARGILPISSAHVLSSWSWLCIAGKKVAVSASGPRWRCPIAAFMRWLELFDALRS